MLCIIGPDGAIPTHTHTRIFLFASYPRTVCVSPSYTYIPNECMHICMLFVLRIFLCIYHIYMFLIYSLIYAREILSGMAAATKLSDTVAGWLRGFRVYFMYIYTRMHIYGNMSRTVMSVYT